MSNSQAITSLLHSVMDEPSVCRSTRLTGCNGLWKHPPNNVTTGHLNRVGSLFTGMTWTMALKYVIC